MKALHFILRVILLPLCFPANCRNRVTLPYHVRNSVLEMTGPTEYIRDLDRVNLSNPNTTRTVYRKDLDPNYIAYYEIEAEEKYVLFSTGPGTGDFRHAQTGPSPRPTDLLIKQANQHGQRCVKFFRLTPLGLFMCENGEGRAVSATFNWTSQTPVQDWRSLQTMVQGSEETFSRIWSEWKAKVNRQFEWGMAEKRDHSNHTHYEFEETISPGSIVKLATHKISRPLRVYFNSLGPNFIGFHPRWQKKLCQVLLKLCKDGGTFVNSELVEMTENGVPYLRFEVSQNRGFALRLFHGQNVGFVIFQGHKTLRNYVINLKSHRIRRSYPIYTSSWQYYIVPEEHLMPDYDQHRCCDENKSCFSGCTAVAWAMIFAYYDRVAHSKRPFGYSKEIFRCKDGIEGSPACVAPGTLTRPKLTHNLKKFVEALRKEMLTYCRGSMGTTRYENIGLVEKWFQERQGSRARVFSYIPAPGWSWGKSKSTLPYGHSTLYGSEDWIRDRAIQEVKYGYPVNVGVKFSWDYRRYDPLIHSAVVTQYRYRYKDYRVCWPRMRTYTVKTNMRRRYCRWKRVHDHQFYYHQGFGGGANGWYQALAQTAHVAKI